MRRSWNDSSTQDLIGQKFDRLLVIRVLPARHNRSRWFCLCDCENTCEADGRALRSGKKRSCGCIRRERARAHAALLSETNKLPAGESAFNLLYAIYRCGAEHRRLEFSLTKDDFKTLTQQRCTFCGKQPAQVIGSKNGSYIYNGIDRINNDVGYLITNVVPCCGICNWMKRTQSINDFLQACQAVTDYQKELNASRNRGAI